MSGIDRSRLPALSPELSIEFPAASRFRLENGLQIRSFCRDRLPLVSVVLLLPAGSAADPPHRPGLAAVTADMLDEGTSTLSALDLHEALARLGTDLDIEVGADAVVVALTILPRFFGDALRLLADVISRPRMAEEDFERVRALRLNRLHQFQDMPVALAEEVFARALYGDHPYGHLSIGNTASLRDLGLDAVTTFHRTAYQPSHATLIVVGHVGDDEIGRVAREAFEEWHGTREVEEGVHTRPAGVQPGSVAAVQSRILIVDRPGAPQTELRIGHVAAARATPDFHALVLLNSVLGGQFVSRINLNLRERKGYTYGARTAFDFRRQPGPFCLATRVHYGAKAH
jgi:zinc protease